MGTSGLSRRGFLAGAMGAAGMTQLRAGAAAPHDELIRVAADGFTFESAETGTPFVPWGANLVRTDKANLDNFGPTYDGEEHEAILAACASLNINLLKVFLPIGSMLPDPQPHGKAAFAAGYLDNLDDFLRRARRHGVRAVVTLSEWGGHGLTWWREGGQYFGRAPWKTDEGPDSIATILDCWRQICARLKGNPAVFSYTTCVEWTMPNNNLTGGWNAPPEKQGQAPGPIALWHWQRWVMSKHGSLSDINDAWGTEYASLDDIPPADYRYGAEGYVSPEAMILDYQNFREWTTLRYMRPQLAAIKEADPTHLVTMSNHMRSWNLWQGAAMHFLGYTPAEEFPYVDYITHHANYDIKDFKEGRPYEQAARETEALARFACAGGVKPVMIEEYNFSGKDLEETADLQESMVRGSVGHASGWTTWYLQYPDNASTVVDAAHPSGWLDKDLKPTPWGLRAKALYGDLLKADRARKAPARTVALDRAEQLVPHGTSTIIDTFTDYEKYPQPTDFTVTHEPDLDLALLRSVPGEGKLRCAPVISGNLRPYEHNFTTSQGIAGWRREMDDERKLGFDLLWISHLRPGLDAPGDAVGDILDVCAERNMQVILDTGATPGWYGPLDTKREVAEVGKTIREIGARYKDHPAFYGWYVPHEIYMCWGRMAAFIDEVYPALVSACKEAAAKPVTLSPFFLLDQRKIYGDFRYAEPEEYQEYWTKLIARSNFDTIMLQDSGEHFAYCTNAMRWPFFQAMKAACDASGAALWGNVETAEFDCPSQDEYLRRYGRVHHSTVKNAPWRAVPMPRLEAKLRLAAHFAERIVCWGYYQYGRPQLSAEAKAWYEAYEKYQTAVRG